MLFRNSLCDCGIVVDDARREEQAVIERRQAAEAEQERVARHLEHLIDLYDDVADVADVDRVDTAIAEIIGHDEIAAALVDASVS